MNKMKIKSIIGIDLGTTSTKIYVKDLGFLGELPTVIAIHKKTQKVIAYGEEANKMLGRSPAYIEIVRPVLQGIITHFDEAMMFLELIIRDALKKQYSLLRPKIIISIPLDLTDVQKRGVIEVAKNSGASEVYLIECPLASALGTNLNIDIAKGTFVVDIGGGTTDIAIISYGGIVLGKSIKIGGDSFNRSICNYVKENFNLIIGEKQAELAKIEIGTIHPRPEKSYLLKGRDVNSGLPREFLFTSQNLRESLEEDISRITLAIKDIINATPPDLLNDISTDGCFLTGGGALIEGLNSYLEKEIKMPVIISDNPKYAAIRGLGKIIEELDYYKRLLINV